jgi:hypothetical protein
VQAFPSLFFLYLSLTDQTIAAGNSTYTLSVTVNGDFTVEPNETFFVNVSNVIGASVGDAQGQGTITNDDVAVAFCPKTKGYWKSNPAEWPASALPHGARNIQLTQQQLLTILNTP